MAKLAAKNINFTVNSVAIEDELTSLDQNLTQEVIQVNGFSTVGPSRVVGNYDWNYSLNGNADFAASQGDATLFALLASTGVATAFDPTGTTAGSDDPNYDATSAVLENYTISGAVGGAVTYTASLQGNSALARTAA